MSNYRKKNGISKKAKDIKPYFDYDIGTRDAPVMFYKGELYIGRKQDTHSTLVQEVILGIDTGIDGLEEYSPKIINEQNLAWCRNSLLSRTGYDLYEDENVLFGHYVKGCIYWEIHDEFDYKDVIEVLGSSIINNYINYYEWYEDVIDYKNKIIMPCKRVYRRLKWQ